MRRSDPHVTRYELPHGSHLRPMRVCHEVVSVEKYTNARMWNFTERRSQAFWCVKIANQFTGSLSDRPRSGHLRDRFTTSQSTSSVVVGNRGRTVSRNTVRNRLRERGNFCRRPQRGVILTERHRRDRRQWAQNNVQRRSTL